MSQEGRAGILLCLCGPAGVGKTVLGKRLLEGNPASLHRSVSLTSRPARSSEQDGVAYHFVSGHEFQERVRAGVLLEWEEVHGHFYGTLRSSVEESLKRGKDLLLIIDIKGCFKIKSAYPLNSVIVFVAPPSFSELSSRMRARGEGNENELATRLETARKELGLLGSGPGGAVRNEQIDYLIVNDDFEACSARLSSILEAERASLIRYSPEFINKITR